MLIVTFSFSFSIFYSTLHIHTEIIQLQLLSNIQNMEKGGADDKVLSYNDVVLRRSDLDILSGPHFLNDRIIEFYFSYLTSCYPSEDILLVPPSIAFWIKECPDSASLQEFLEPLHLPQRKLIIFPINDNSDVSIAEGGSHWSLLVFERNANVFVHHDSSSAGMNSVHSMRVYRAVATYTASDAKFINWSGSPRQTNCYDCGLYVTAIARAICEWYGSAGPAAAGDLWLSSVKEQITLSLVSRMRKEILELVRTLMVKRENWIPISIEELLIFCGIPHSSNIRIIAWVGFIPSTWSDCRFPCKEKKKKKKLLCESFYVVSIQLQEIYEHFATKVFPSQIVTVHEFYLWYET